MLLSGDAQVTLLLVPHKIAKLLPRNSSLARRWWRLPSERTRNRMFDLKGKDDTGRLRRRVSGTHNPPTDRKMRPVLLAFRPSAFSLSLSLFLLLPALRMTLIRFSSTRTDDDEESKSQIASLTTLRYATEGANCRCRRFFASFPQGENAANLCARHSGPSSLPPYWLEISREFTHCSSYPASACLSCFLLSSRQRR